MPAAPPVISIRATIPADIPSLYQFQLDPDSNRLAGTKPRNLQSFNEVWEKIFRDSVATPRVILADGKLVGSINIFKLEGADFIGYWIDRPHWGRGIATRALALMLQEFTTRPLFATACADNAASLRALERNGFVVSSRCHSPETERFVARETVTLTLA